MDLLDDQFPTVFGIYHESPDDPADSAKTCSARLYSIVLVAMIFLKFFWIISSGTIIGHHFPSPILHEQQAMRVVFLPHQLSTRRTPWYHCTLVVTRSAIFGLVQSATNFHVSSGHEQDEQ
jgi:hypothetical protein